MPLTALIVLGGAPLVYQSIRILRKNYHHPLKMMSANLAMIRIHSLTGILLIMAYAWQGIRVGTLAGKDALLTFGPSSKVLGKNVDGRILSETG